MRANLEVVGVIQIEIQWAFLHMSSNGEGCDVSGGVNLLPVLVQTLRRLVKVLDRLGNTVQHHG